MIHYNKWIDEVKKWAKDMKTYENEDYFYASNYEEEKNKFVDLIYKKSENKIFIYRMTKDSKIPQEHQKAIILLNLQNLK